MPDIDVKKKFAQGETIFREGEMGDCAYIILSGAVEISRLADGEKIVLATRGPGDIFGEMAIVDDKPRSASVVALGECELLVFSKEQLQGRLTNLDPVLRMVFNVTLERFRDSIRNTSQLTVEPPRSAAECEVRMTESAAVIERIELEQAIRTGLKRREFELFFQPIIRTETERVAGFEALARWRHPERGLLAPWAFIEVAEESGLVTELSRWAVKEACEASRRFNASLPMAETVFVAVNVTGADLCDPSFAGVVESAMTDVDLTPEALVVEVTESMLIENPSSAIEMLNRLRELGLSLSVDDFGTGYSSLNYLSRYPIQKMKIDKSFVDVMGEGGKSQDIVRAMVELGHILHLEVVAEGVETPDQVETLRVFGCDYLQGYHYAKPQPFELSLDLLKRFNGEAAAALNARALAWT